MTKKRIYSCTRFHIRFKYEIDKKDENSIAFFRSLFSCMYIVLLCALHWLRQYFLHTAEKRKSWKMATAARDEKKNRPLEYNIVLCIADCGMSNGKWQIRINFVIHLFVYWFVWLAIYLKWGKKCIINYTFIHQHSQRAAFGSGRLVEHFHWLQNEVNLHRISFFTYF